jgi:RNA polymerase sigma factor (sigma-70 family)
MYTKSGTQKNEQKACSFRMTSVMMMQLEHNTKTADASMERIWYEPDERIYTPEAADRAKAIAEQIPYVDEDVSEHDLFVAMHVGAWQVTRDDMYVKPEARQAWLNVYRKIRDHIVEQNLGLVHMMARRSNQMRVDPDELISEGMVALTRAVERFNPWKGFRFSTYACNSIWRALGRLGKLESRHHTRFPAMAEMPVDIPESSPDHARDFYVERLNRVLDHNMAELTDLESTIISGRFPVGQDDKMTYRELGGKVGLSKERVRQIQNIALDKLRLVLEQDPLLQ